MKPTVLVLCLAGLAACDSSLTQTKAASAIDAQAAPAPSSLQAKPAEAPVLDPNEVLAARVKQALEAKFQAIDVTASDGAITLWGTTSTKAERKRAEGAAAKVEGVKSVDNRIAVVKGS